MDSCRTHRIISSPDGETLERLNIGGFEFAQPQYGYRFSVDALLLADFVRAKARDRLIDLGTGSGILPLLLAELTPAQHIVGLEIQPRLVGLARRNVARNGVQDRITILHADLKEVPRSFQAGTFDVLCANPPYRKIGAGRLNPQSEQAIARHEIACTIFDVAAAAKFLLKPGGKGFFIYLAERLSDLMQTLRNHALEPKSLRCIHSHPTDPASLVLLEARRDGAPGLTILPPLSLYRDTQEYSEEARRILRIG